MLRRLFSIREGHHRQIAFTFIDSPSTASSDVSSAVQAFSQNVFKPFGIFDYRRNALVSAGAVEF
jgi:hypothetical protein